MKRTLLVTCTLFIGLNLTAAGMIVPVGGAPFGGADSAQSWKSISALPSQMPTPNPGQLIAYDQCNYTFDDTGEILCGVYLVSTDGLGQPYGISDAINPSWSPDGSRIAFVRYTQPGLFVYDLNSGSITSVHNGGESPAWSPDGTKLA